MLLFSKPIESPILFCSSVPAVIAGELKTQDVMVIKGVFVPSDCEITIKPPSNPLKMPNY